MEPVQHQKAAEGHYECHSKGLHDCDRRQQHAPVPHHVQQGGYLVVGDPGKPPQVIALPVQTLDDPDPGYGFLEMGVDIGKRASPL